MSRIGSPASRRRSASLIWLGVSFGGRPILRRGLWREPAPRLSGRGSARVRILPARQGRSASGNHVRSW